MRCEADARWQRNRDGYEPTLVDLELQDDPTCSCELSELSEFLEVFGMPVEKRFPNL